VAALRLLLKEESAAALARRYQVSEQTLCRWRDDCVTGGRKRLGRRWQRRKKQDRGIAAFGRELGKRAQVIGELTLANNHWKELQEYPG